MKKISANVVADSISSNGYRITTFMLTFPRFILAELNTHRVFSKNSASSRAIPFEKMVKMCQEDPFIPIAWQKNHAGMQGTDYITDKDDIELNKNAWLKARDNAISSASYLNHGVREGRDNGITKQLCNRLLEPFMWHTVLLTATEFDNFFKLRAPKYELFEDPATPRIFNSKRDALMNPCFTGDFSDEHMSELDWIKLSKSRAEIHMQALAEAMWDARNSNQPKQLKDGEWHIPFANSNPTENLDIIEFMEKSGFNLNKLTVDDIKIRIASARCARLSYYTLNGKEETRIEYHRDISLHDELLSNGHMSPFEHCARAMTSQEYYRFIKGEGNPEDDFDGYAWCNNFRGFVQYRYLLENK